jgi:diguanylate cyclase (GGDEF)-like protein/PAS domain S-box-containing protein
MDTIIDQAQWQILLHQSTFFLIFLMINLLGGLLYRRYRRFAWAGVENDLLKGDLFKGNLFNSSMLDTCPNHHSSSQNRDNYICQTNQTQISLLKKIIYDVHLAKDFESSLLIALQLVCEKTGWEFAEAWLPNSEHTLLEYSPVWYGKSSKWQKYHFSSHNFSFAKHQGLPGRVWGQCQPIWIPDVSSLPVDLFIRQNLAEELGVKAGLGVPIIVNQKLLAVIVFFTSTYQEKNYQEIELVKSIGMQLGAILHAKLLESKYRSIFDNAVEGIFQTSPNGNYISVNPALANIYGYASPAIMMAKITDIENQLYVDPQRRKDFIDLLESQDVVVAFESQVHRADGKIIWIAENARAVRNSHGKLLYYEGFVVDITERKATESALRYQATHDHLTGFWNWDGFIEQVNLAIEQSQEESFVNQECDNLSITNQSSSFAILSLDLDDFKYVNESLGHRLGNQLLLTLAQRIEDVLMDCQPDLFTCHHIARLGGDEFSLILEKFSDNRAVTEVAEKILGILQNPFEIGRHQIFVRASIGIAYYSSDYQFPQDLVQDAEIALYHAKDNGRGSYVIFDPMMRQATLQRLELETELRLALQQNQLQVYYQPIVQLSSGKIIGFEALARWHHPEKGFISPCDFIPVAEETGLIKEIGELVLTMACQQLASWNKQNSHSDHALTISVNISGKQLQPDLPKIIDRVLAETGLPASNLKLEITETVIMKEPQEAIAILNELAERGIQLFIDDFGTGYCSLSYLQQFPFSGLKIDRSFIKRVLSSSDNTHIVKTIISLAEILNLHIVAEGIEMVEQLNYLRSLHCDYGQGFWFSKPLNSEAAKTLLSQYQMIDS